MKTDRPYVYITCCLVNNKIYIGQHCGTRDNYIGSGVSISKAIKRYGKENFTCTILQFCDTQEELDMAEILWIAHFQSTDRRIGYNLSIGGSGSNGYKLSQKAKDKISRSKKIDCRHITIATIYNFLISSKNWKKECKEKLGISRSKLRRTMLERYNVGGKTELIKLFESKKKKNGNNKPKHRRSRKS